MKDRKSKTPPRARVAERLNDLLLELDLPRRTLWRSFLTGVATGAGVVVGGSMVGAILLVTLMAGLKKAFAAAGGIPWVGGEVKEALGFILQAIHDHQGVKP